jgi:hypothetical protein
MTTGGYPDAHQIGNPLEMIMIFGGGILGTILIIALIVYLVRRGRI